MLILALGQNMSELQAAGQQPKTVTLALSPSDAEKLVYITEYATVRMALRNPDDGNYIKSSGITRDDMAAGKGTLVLPK